MAGLIIVSVLVLVLVGAILVGANIAVFSSFLEKSYEELQPHFWKYTFGIGTIMCLNAFYLALVFVSLVNLSHL